MTHEQVKPLLQKQMDELRQRLNKEIERNSYNLNAPSVMRLSRELDIYIIEQYREYMPMAQ
jgi:hypothetical protein